jgi:hypothetical protein
MQSSFNTTVWLGANVSVTSRTMNMTSPNPDDSSRVFPMGVRHDMWLIGIDCPVRPVEAAVAAAPDQEDRHVRKVS